jgi:ribosomal protein S18 acetylase RimI-like enzyme
MKKITIRETKVKNWKSFRAIRLEALKTDPKSFGASYEEEIKKTPRTWQDRFKDKNRKVFLAFSDAKVVGMTVVSFESSLKTQHLAKIYSVYVSPSYRRQGIAEKLMEDAIKKVKQIKRIKKVKLQVVTQQNSAIHLYKKMGFKIVGKLKKDLKIRKNYYDSYIMERFL